MSAKVGLKALASFASPKTHRCLYYRYGGNGVHASDAIKGGRTIFEQKASCFLVLIFASACIVLSLKSNLPFSQNFKVLWFGFAHRRKNRWARGLRVEAFIHIFRFPNIVQPFYRTAFSLGGFE